MTLNPLVEKILQSTVEKALDMSILNDLEFTPDEGCEAIHANLNPSPPCQGAATHWQEMNLHKAPPKKVCSAIVEFAAEHAENICANCSENGNHYHLWQCWHYEPIQK